MQVFIVAHKSQNAKPSTPWVRDGRADNTTRSRSHTTETENGQTLANLNTVKNSSRERSGLGEHPEAVDCFADLTNQNLRFH